MVTNRKLRRSGINTNFFVYIPALYDCSEYTISRMNCSVPQNKVKRNTCINPSVRKRKKAARESKKN